MWSRACKCHLTLTVLALFYLRKEINAVKLTAIRFPPFAKVGDSVAFKCDYDLEQVDLYSIKWYWNEEEFYRYVPKESPPFRSFSVKYIKVNVSKSGENVVTLQGVQRQLTGDYKCEVSADGPLFHTDILVAHMIVVEAPNERPVMKIEPNKIEVGKKIMAECFVLPCYPAANITWFVNNNKIQRTSESIRIYQKQDEQDPILGLWSSRSRMEISLEKSHIIQGIIRVQCLASIYSVWNDTAEEDLRDETPKLAQILESTSYHSQMGSIIGPGECRVDTNWLSDHRTLLFESQDDLTRNTGHSTATESGYNRGQSLSCQGMFFLMCIFLRMLLVIENKGR